MYYNLDMKNAEKRINYDDDNKCFKHTQIYIHSGRVLNDIEYFMYLISI